MKAKQPENLKIKLDEIVYALFKGLVKHAFSKIEETKTGFVYTVDFKKRP